MYCMVSLLESGRRERSNGEVSRRDKGSGELEKIKRERYSCIWRLDVNCFSQSNT